MGRIAWQIMPEPLAIIFKKFPVCLCCIMIGIFLLNSCSPCFYTPNAQNVPMFRGSREGMANFSLQLGSYSNGLNIQTAFSVHDHIGIMLNYHHYGASYDDALGPWHSTEDGHFRGNYGEAGIGYFLTFDEKWLFETYGGIGFGKVVNERTGDYQVYSMPYHKAKVNYNRYFIQPAVGWSLNEHFELAVSGRFCLLNYKELVLTAGEENNIFQITGVRNNPLFLFEPAFTLRVGGKNVKFQYQITYSENFGNHEEYFDPLGVSFAVFFKIHGNKK